MAADKIEMAADMAEKIKELEAVYAEANIVAIDAVAELRYVEAHLEALGYAVDEKRVLAELVSEEDAEAYEAVWDVYNEALDKLTELREQFNKAEEEADAACDAEEQAEKAMRDAEREVERAAEEAAEAAEQAEEDERGPASWTAEEADTIKKLQAKFRKSLLWG
jgi:chromosome segregation ATPase